jgi:hypothetical protein
MTPVGRGGAAGGERHGKTNRRYSTELAYARIVPAMRWGVAWPPAAAGRWGPGRRPSHTGAGPGRRGGDETRHYCDPGDKSTRARGRDDDQASWQHRNSRARSIEIHPQQQIAEHVPARACAHVRTCQSQSIMRASYIPIRSSLSQLQVQEHKLQQDVDQIFIESEFLNFLIPLLFITSQ